ncbi:MAG: hypothetical protein ACYDB3_01415 [Acidimicrobiales bacterium]
MTTASDDLPEASGRRLAGGAFTSGLSVPDFAACLQMGLEPVGYVQGFCVMQWGWYGTGSPYLRGADPYGGTRGQYSESWRCPHGFVTNEHRSWGQNYEQSWVESAWDKGFGAAYSRMIDEAVATGAHGVIGVVDTTAGLGEMGVLEFQIRGTAVKVAGGPPPPQGRPWTTYLAGQRLAKLVEAGYMPISIAATISSVRVWAYCITEYLMEGSTYSWGAQMAGAEVEQVAKAHMAARHVARERVRAQLHGDELHGAAMTVSERELSEGDELIECTLRGNRVRRFKDFDPMPPPRPAVRLS